MIPSYPADSEIPAAAPKRVADNTSIEPFVKTAVSLGTIS